MRKQIFKQGKSSGEVKRHFSTRLKVGDSVLVIAGGNSKKENRGKGRVGEILRFMPKKDRVVVKGVNIVTRHKRANKPGDTTGRIEKEGSVHISNVMYYSSELKRPVRLVVGKNEVGKRVRGYLNPDTKVFEAIES